MMLTRHVEMDMTIDGKVVRGWCATCGKMGILLERKDRAI